MGGLLRRRGANAIEFALCMPVFVLMIAGLVDFGWLFFHRSAVDAAVQAGCRAGSLVDPMMGDPDATAAAAMVASLRDNGVPCVDTCTTSVVDVGTVPNRALQCTLSIRFHPLFGLLSSDTPVSSTTQARFEWQRDPAAITTTGS